jgi:hypothetical protein
VTVVDGEPGWSNRALLAAAGCNSWTAHFCISVAGVAGSARLAIASA